ncbi:hypothetical protein [Paenibacillus harenae]|uniref:hypothetical protein n=1 Tax=Paenibacillus harenae TaxID=306543 RepID=UPI000413F73F|nr:hypothetical protein [Paenibacillus harenae]
MANASSIIIFPDGPWSDIPVLYQKLFEKLMDRHPVYIVTSQFQSDPVPAGLTAISMNQTSDMDWNESVAVVMQPYLAPIAIAAAPKKLIAMPRSPRENEPALLTKCRKWLCGHADLIIVDSEPYYLKQTFCTEHVFLLDGRDEGCDLLTLQAFFWTLDGYTPKPLARLQQRSLADGYERKLREHAESNEAIAVQDLFNHAVYRYLIYDLERAKGALLSSFGLAVKEGKIDALRKYYRFLSAIETKQGLTRQAVRSYSFTAITPDEKKTVRQMEEWLFYGKDGLAAAMLYSLNADFQQAMNQLELVEPEPAAKGLVTESSIQAGRLNKAMEHISADPPESEDEVQQYALLCGTTAWLTGKRHEAGQAFSKAGEARHKELACPAEWDELETALRELALERED